MTLRPPSPPDDRAVSAARLGSMTLFRGLPLSALESLAASARMKSFEKGERIFNQGDECVRAHVVVRGAVRIAETGRDGAQVAVRFVGANETFGTLALFAGHRYPADAICLEATLEASWSEADFKAEMDRQPSIAGNLIRIVGERLREAQERLRELATQPAPRRLAQAILRLAGEDDEVGFALRRRDLADLTGMTLYSASRIMTAWRRRGLVGARGGRLRILRRADLRQIADEA